MNASMGSNSLERVDWFVHAKKKKELTKTNVFILLLDGQYLTLFPL